MYFVIGGDGQQYGPVDAATLSQWRGEGRINDQSQVKDQASGMQVALLSILGPAMPVPPAPAAPSAYQGPQGSAYPRGYDYGQAPQYAGNTYARTNNWTSFWISIAYSVGGLAMRFFVGGFGVIFCIYGIVHSVRAKDQNTYWWIPLTVSIICTLVCGISLFASYSSPR